MTGIEEFHATITSRGYGYMRPVLERTFYNSLCIEVTDPFGNRIRFNQELPPEDQATTGPQLFSQDN
jgi:ribosomal-protein-alanine N-acetyltransferase